MQLSGPSVSPNVLFARQKFWRVRRPSSSEDRVMRVWYSHFTLGKIFRLTERSLPTPQRILDYASGMGEEGNLVNPTAHKAMPPVEIR
jgi:hypothetical protein